ncbi:MAG: MBOAT family protein [Bacteroidetes bacterium]|nr:MBOAT family protein [Bacteroidota bacterium]
MLFNSIVFLIFFITVTIGYYALAPRFRWILLLVASSYFYMYFYPPYLLILLFLILVDYFAAIVIDNAGTEKKKKIWLTISLIANIGILAFFKYYNFLNENVEELCISLGWTNPIPALTILLPIGLSFHTFQSMSYTIEVYRGNIKPERHLGIYALFVMFYPQLVAGPIERGTTLLPQLKKNDNRLEYDNVMIGLSQMLYGLFKKVVVADSLAMYVNSIYSYGNFNTGFTALFATWMFAFQIYCDFSGYSDIAIGAGRVMGYRMMTNFSIPYFSKSVTEFWRRWHISLSTWLRDYLYFSLGGNRKGKWRTYLNNMLTMLLGGLWHGASWNFVIWGGLNGVYLAGEKMFNVKVKKPILPFWKKAAYAFLTFNLICLTWVFFRAHTFEGAVGILSSIFNPVDWLNLRIQDTSIFFNMISMLALLLVFDYFIFRKKNAETFYRTSSRLQFSSFHLLLLIIILLFGVSEGDQFIYFQF